MLKISVVFAALMVVAVHPPSWAANHTHTHAEGSGHQQSGAATVHQGGHWTAPAHARQMVSPVPPTSGSIGDGAVLFQENCAACHGSTGRGDGELAADLETKPSDLMAMAPTHEPGDFAWKIINGRGEMPPWEGVLSDEEIWHVVNFLKELPALDGSPLPMHGASGIQHGG